VAFGKGVRDTTHIIGVPWCAGDVREWLPGVLAEYCGDLPKRPKKLPRVLVGHFGIADADTPSYLRGSHDSVEADYLGRLCAEHDITHVFAGHWHQRNGWRVNDVRIHQLGALVPTGWDNPGFVGYGHVAILDCDTGEVSWTEIPGPRFLGANMADDDELITTAESQDYHIYVDDAPREDPGIKEAARAAAEAAQSSSTLDDAVAAYVEEMPLDEGVDRAAVLAKAKEYLGK
jgi:hypothetical protein